MSVSIAQQVDLLYKQAFGVTKTDTANNKSPSNESIPSPLLIRGDTQWTQSDQIPAVAAAVANLVQAYTGASAVQMTADNTTVPIGGIYPTWKTNLTYWIPQEFGATYAIKVYVDNPGAANPTVTGTQIFAAGSGGTGEFYYNYQSGVLNFIGETIPASLTSGKVLYAVGYRYIGLVGVTNLPSGTTIGNLEFTNNVISSTNTNANIVLTPNGTGQVTTTASFTGTDVYIANLVANTSGNIFDLVVANKANLGNIANVILTGGSNGQVVQTDGAGNLSFATISTSGVSNGNSSVTIPTVDGNINLTSNGNLSLVVTSTGANVTGDLGVSGNLNVILDVSGNTANFTNAVTISSLTVNNNLGGNTANFSGNIDAANANLGNLVIANHFQGDVINGNSNISIVPNGNILFSVSAAAANVVTISNVGINVVGYVSANGDGNFGALKSNSLTALSGNLQLVSEQSGNSFIELKPFGNGTVDVANFRITSLATPNAASDAATKQYVDDVAQGLNIHDACYVATTDELTTLTDGGTITYNNGANGVGATLTLTGTYVKDFTTANCFDANTTAVASSRILVKNEVSAPTNGIYVVSNATVLVRAADFNTVPEIEPGDFVFVQDGNTYGNTGWVQTASVTTIGTDPIVFTQFSGAGTYQAGSGLTLTGTTFSVNVDNLTTEISGGNVVVKANAQLTTPNIDAATGTSVDLTGNVLANNLNANTKITTFDLDASNVATINSLTVNTNISGNTANFTGNANFSGANVDITNWLTVSNTANIGTVRTDNLQYANGTPWDFQAAAGSNNQIQYNSNNDFAASANFTYDDTAQLFTVLGNGQFNNANLGNLATANFINAATEINTASLLSNTGNFSGNVIVPNLTVNVELDGNTANFNNATISDLSVSNTANLGNVGNVTILGGSANQYLQTNGSGVLTWATVDSSSISNGTSNVNIPSVNGNVVISVAGIANVIEVGSSNVTISNNLSVIDTISAGNVNANSNVNTTNLYANQIYANNTANFLGDVLANANLTVNLDLDGNTANFSTSVGTPLLFNGNSNIGIAANGNISFGISGNANVLFLSNTSANLTGDANISGNLNVSGNFSVASLVANNLTANNSVTIGDTLITYSNVQTTAITANQTIAQIPVNGYVGVQFLVRGHDTIGGKYSIATVQAVTDGSNVDYSVFGSVALNGITGTLAVNINGANIALQVTPTSSNSTVWTTQYRLV
jgi:hypothetical protein